MPSRARADVTSMRRAALAALAGGLTLMGCTTYYAVERTPEGVLESVKAGDTVRIRTRASDELELLVWTLSDSEIAGRLDGGDSEEIGRVRYDRIETIEVERLNFRKAVLTTFVPVIVGAIIFCNNEDCETRSGVTADY